MIMILRYIILAGPPSGWAGYVGEFADKDVALNHALDMMTKDDNLLWFQVVDLMTKQIVATERGLTKAGRAQ